MKEKKGTFPSIDATFDSFIHRAIRIAQNNVVNFPHTLWEHTYIYKMTSDSNDNQVPHFRTVFLALHARFSYMTGIYLLNSSSSSGHSHQTSVLNDDSFGVDCTEKTAEIRRLSFSEITKRRGELAWMLTWR